MCLCIFFMPLFCYIFPCRCLCPFLRLCGARITLTEPDVNTARSLQKKVAEKGFHTLPSRRTTWVIDLSLLQEMRNRRKTRTQRIRFLFPHPDKLVVGIVIMCKQFFFYFYLRISQLSIVQILCVYNQLIWHKRCINQKSKVEIWVGKYIFSR